VDPVAHAVGRVARDFGSREWFAVPENLHEHTVPGLELVEHQAIRAAPALGYRGFLRCAIDAEARDDAVLAHGKLGRNPAGHSEVIGAEPNPVFANETSTAARSRAASQNSLGAGPRPGPGEYLVLDS
jgi:hypothetical protein